LSALIDDILDATRIEKGTMRLAEQECDLAELAEIAAKMCRDLALKSDVRIAAKLMSGLEVAGDGTRIRQVLINLITNAIKFSPPGGEVEMHFERGVDGGASVLVKDKGAGIAPADLERIFEPFVQADGGSTRRYGGLGLGLAIARKIARLHGGDVTLASAPEQGTEARFIIPAARVRWPQAKAA
jgi:signal transduction histidine kinase